MSPMEAAQHKNPIITPTPKTRLCRSIRSLICLTLICSGGLVSQNSLADTTDTRNEDTIEVTHPFPSTPEPDPWPVNDAAPGGNSGGGGGGHGSAPSPSACPMLLTQKPAQCPNPIPLPGGPEYARELFPNGSGLAKLHYYRQQANTSPRAKGQVTAALNGHTNMIVAGGYSVNQINELFFNMLSTACRFQTQDSDAYRLGIGLTNPERLCLDAMGRLQAEAEPTMSFTQFFAQWLNREGISLSDYFPQTLVNALSPANSLKIKYDHVTKETICSRWWTQMQEDQCTL